jgi:hypothetical protein
MLEHLSSPGICGVRVTRSLVLYACFIDRCLSFFFCPLCWPCFFNIRIRITPLVYLNSSYPNGYINVTTWQISIMFNIYPPCLFVYRAYICIWASVSICVFGSFKNKPVMYLPYLIKLICCILFIYKCDTMTCFNCLF